MTRLKKPIQRLRQFLRPSQWPRSDSSRASARLSPPRFIDCAQLEDRTLFNATPLGVEAVVNTTTANSQQTFAETPQAVASDANGNYVVAWSSLNQDGSGWGIYAQRFNSAGVAQGGEIQVNSATANDQQFAAVAMDADGDFVVVWSTDASGDAGVRAQRFNAAGVAQGGEIAVNAYTTNDQTWASVAMDANGNFVITWSSINQDGGGWGIYAERFNAAGGGQGDFLVNTTTAGDQLRSHVAMDADGDFVITWEADLQIGTGFGVFGQRYDASGAAQGGEFLINTTTAGDQRRSAVAMDAAGNFVVTWTSTGQDGSGGGIYAQRYNASGATVGGEFLVNATTGGDQDYSSVSMNSSGEFVITWSSFDQDTAGTWGVYAQKYTAAGAVEEAEFRVNTTVAGNQQYSGVAMTANNTAVFIWSGNGAGDGDGVFMQRYNFNDSLIITTTGSALAYIENVGAVAVDPGVTVTDADNSSITGATIIISGNYHIGEDTLSFTDMGSISGVWDSASGTLTLSGASSLANYQAALRSITYTNNSDVPATATRTVSFWVSDTTATSNIATRDITITAANDAPVLASVESGSLAYIENGSSLITASITTADTDDGVLAGATIQITGNYALGQDLLTFTNTPNITGTWDAASGTLTLTGADSLAAYQSALRSVGYVNASDSPNTATRTVSFRVNDGASNSNTQTRDVAISAVNDAPLNNVPGLQITAEDTPLVFSSGNGNLISISDIDAALNPVRVSLSAANGTLTLSQTAGLSFSTGDGAADADLTFTGTAAAINAALDGLIFTPIIDLVGAANIQILTDDQGNTGSGGALSANDTVSLSIEAENDAPINNVPGIQSIGEDTPLVFSNVTGNLISVSDIDAAGSPLRVALTAANGTLTLSQTTGLSFATGDGYSDVSMAFVGTTAAINAALNGLTFTPLANYVGLAGFQIVTDDQGNSGVGGAQVDANSVGISVNAVNDAPDILAPFAQTTSGSTLLFSSSQGNAITLADVDSGAGALEVVLTAANGTITLAGTWGITIVEGTGTADNRMVLRGTLADLNQAIDGLSFSPTALSAQLGIVLSDLGNTGAGGGASVSRTIDIVQSLAPPPPTSPSPPDDGGSSGDDGPHNRSDSDNARSDASQTASAPAIGAPPPRPADAGSLDRIIVARSTALPSSVVVATPVLGMPNQSSRIAAVDLENGDQRSLDQEEASRVKPVLVDKSRHLEVGETETMLWNELREVHEALESVFATPWTFGAIAGLGALSAGYVLWGLQAGSLVTSALSSLPVWGSFDPLPVLEFWERDSKRKDRQKLDEEDQLLQGEPQPSDV